nr:RES family NAD+ phosphorylase [Paracoccus saliphilus]
MTATRGPSGAADPPPADLHDHALPIRSVGAGADLFRVHRTTFSPCFYGPGEGNPPTYRFDSASSAFGVLYVAPRPDAAIIETLLRNPARMTVSAAEVAVRSLSILQAPRELRLVDATGPNLSRLGTTAALSTGPYDPCGLWSDALFSHPDQPDGIAYASRHNPDELCFALFERSDLLVEEHARHALKDQLQLIGRVLDRHDKSLFGKL